MKGHVSILFLCLVLITSFFSFRDAKIDYSRAYEKAPITKVDAVHQTYLLGFVGDIMMDRAVKRTIDRNTASYNEIFDSVRKDLHAYDILFGNLEGPASDKGSDQGSLYSFRMNPDSLGALSIAGFDILSVANNHAFDYGLEAFVDTLLQIENNNMLYVGGGNAIEEAYTPRVKTLSDGTTIGFLAFSDFGKNWMDARKNRPGIAITNSDFIQPAVEILKKEVDIVVISIHFGEEYESLPNERQQHIAYTAIDAGADLVIGHHPHVLQPLERYKDGYVAYSLGNFVFDQNFSTETMTGGVLEVEIENKKIHDAVVRTTYQDPDFRVHFYNP